MAFSESQTAGGGPARVLALQRSIGNRAVTRMIRAERAAFVDDAYGEDESEAEPGTTLGRQGSLSDPTLGLDGPVTTLDAPRAGKVTKVTAITSTTDAVSGFPTIDGVDLNKPGLFNDAQTGACRNVQQIKFDLSGIPAGEVELLRKKDGEAGPVGKEQARKGPDGPSEVTKVRGKSFIAVADDPGIAKAGEKAFPIRYAVDFALYAFDMVSKAILATVTYTVNILKKSIDDSSPVNEFKNLKTKLS